MTKVAELAWLWVKRRPYIQEALEKGVINHSALARIANREIKGSEVAVKAALIRMARKLGKEKRGVESKVLSLMRNSELDVKAKVVVVISKERMENAIASVRGPNGWVSVLEEAKAPGASKRVERNLDLILLSSPAEIEKVPGVISYIMQRLAAENVNIIHMSSAWRDTMLVVRDIDTPKAYKILSEIVR